MYHFPRAAPDIPEERGRRGVPLHLLSPGTSRPGAGRLSQVERGRKIGTRGLLCEILWWNYSHFAQNLKLTHLGQ